MVSVVAVPTVKAVNLQDLQLQIQRLLQIIQQLQEQISQITRSQGEGSTTSGSTCTDSDGGKNYYVKGVATARYSTGGEATLIDSCCTDINDRNCNKATGSVVNEAYCRSDNSVDATQYLCPQGYTCRDGACVKTTVCKPYIHVLFPNNREQLIEDSECPIIWDASCLPSDAKISITIFRSNDANALIVSNLPSTQREYKWKVSTNYEWAMPCFAKGTEVLMSNGFYKNIENIKEGEYVTSYNIQTKKFSTSRVLQVIHR
ncbi:MAG: hypothetical protein J7L14_01280, partial [Candidatus Diapherotrites archaeon]|nr:hypothetical protein [Candidatus Diapherotrites archaeon]